MASEAGAPSRAAPSDAEVTVEGGSPATWNQRPRITTNTIQPEELAPIPEGFEFLYATGEGVPATVNIVLVDGDSMFWGGQGLIWRAPTDGTGDPVAFAHWDGAAVSVLVSDTSYLYWHDRNVLKRKRKDSSAVVPSPPRVRHNFPWRDGFSFTYQEEVEALDLDSDYPIAYFDSDGRYLYLAPTDCTPIHVIDLSTFANVDVLRFERPERTGGSTSLRVSGDRIYCKNANRLFVVSTNGDDARVLTEELQNGGALVAVEASDADPAAYALDFAGGGRSVRLTAIARSGELAGLGESPVAGGADVSSRLDYDAARRRLGWIGAGGGGEGFWLTTFNVDTHQYEPVRPLFSTSAFTSDEHHFYWVGHLTSESEITTILRLHKDATARAATAYSSR